VSIRSTRKMEDLHGDSIRVRVIFPMRYPDHSTINRFRKDNETELAGLFLYVLQKCGDADMIDPDTAIVETCLADAGYYSMDIFDNLIIKCILLYL